MKSNTILVDNYFGLISGWSTENKIKLIAKIANSIVEETVRNENKVTEFFGTFKSERSADELISEIHEIRTFNRITETF